MVRSTLLGVGSLRFERLQPLGEIWQNQDYNKSVFLTLCAEYLCHIDPRRQSWRVTYAMELYELGFVPNDCARSSEQLMFNCHFWSEWGIMRNWEHQKSFRHIRMTSRSHCRCLRVILDGPGSSMLIFKIVKNLWFSENSVKGECFAPLSSL